jgi:integrase
VNLTAKRIARLLKRPGRYLDGHGLVLQVVNPNNASWLLRYQRDGRERWMGLGPLHTVGLADARIRARTARLQLLDGIDPLKAKKDAKEAAKLAAARTLTFTEAAETYFRTHEAEWRSVKHAQQWIGSLRTYAYPVLGRMDVAAITKMDVLRVVEPLWADKTVTADRTRNRIETVLNWCIVRGHREGENPARWRGYLEHALPAPSRIAKPQNLAALPYVELPEFMKALRQRDGVAARALEFTVLTAARTGETRGAQWSEIDIKNRLWTIPAERMKAGREHRVSLSPQVIALLQALPKEKDNPFVFIGARAGGLSHPSLGRVLNRMGRSDITTHGFRSAFSTWAHERTKHSNHTIEICLAHSVGNKTEKSYQRGDLLAKRRQLMQAWAKLCCSPPKIKGKDKPKAEDKSNIVTLRAVRQ